VTMKINGLQVLLLGVLPSLICAMETIDVLVVLIQWENHENRTLIPKEQIDQLWNGPGNNTVVPGESISEYLESNTYGKYKVSADVHDWYKMNVTEEYASKGKLGTTGYGEDIEEILGPVLEAIVENGVNLTKYADENGQLTGIVRQMHKYNGYPTLHCLPFSHDLSRGCLLGFCPFWLRCGEGRGWL
jgi:hypothetical protein